MAKKLLMELNPAAAAAVETLMREYGESSPESTVSRALGFLQAVRPYLDEGILTVLDPSDGRDEFVELVFEHVAAQAPAPLPDRSMAAPAAA